MPRPRFVAPIIEFLRTEAAGGVALLIAAGVALVWANTPWSAAYYDLWHSRLQLGAAHLSITLDLQHWVNDGLMTLFFFVVGIEIKRELVRGELRDVRAAAVPTIAALGGMVVPALLFLAITAGTAEGHGWGIPMATDIALAVGVLALVGRHAPPRLRVFLLTLAIVDDIGAIFVIAIFYAGDIAWGWLAVAVGIVFLMLAMRRFVGSPIVYVPFALGVWIATFESGVHATIAGVALGLLTPAGSVRGRPLIEQLERRLHPWTSFVVVPVFALANAGVDLAGDAIAGAFRSRVGIGAFVGLVIGKPVGVIGATMLALACGLRLPEGVRRTHIVGAGVLAGLGFTVSLFVAGLAFPGGMSLQHAEIAVFAASLLAGGVGGVMLVRVRSGPVTTVALVDDLMDRSRISQAMPEVTFVRSATDCADADVVLVDLARHVGSVAAVRAVAPGARIVCFGPHVDETAATTARDAGADEVLARSRFFHDPAAATRS